MGNSREREHVITRSRNFDRLVFLENRVGGKEAEAEEGNSCTKAGWWCVPSAFDPEVDGAFPVFLLLTVQIHN